jgi:N-methylhydantoinase B/oxoprolinase/acetone carboxylase alpha subunit
MESSGGGGWGDSAQRDPAETADDVANEFVSRGVQE